jgi:flagellar motor switch protein FliN/FliY
MAQPLMLSVSFIRYNQRMADTPTDPAPAAAPPTTSAPAESVAAIDDLQAGVAALAASAAALDQAAATAADIVQEVQSVTPGASAAQNAGTNASAQNVKQPSGTAGGTNTAELSTIPPELRRLLVIEVPIIVRLGVRKMSVGEVIRFAVGAIIELQKASDEDLDLLANNLPVGRGQAVKVGENFGIRLTQVGSVKETIRKLGGT